MKAKWTWGLEESVAKQLLTVYPGIRKMMNIYLTDSDEGDIVDFVKDYEELYDKSNDMFKSKTSKDCLWKRFASSCNHSVKVCKTCFKFQRTGYGKLIQLRSSQAPSSTCIYLYLNL